MPSWSAILTEMQDEVAKGNSLAADTVRRKYLALLSNETKRNTIFYATKCTQPCNVDPRLITITDEDIQGFMEVVHGLSGNTLDLILHSPGGSIEAAAAIVSYLRTKFTDLRVIVPNYAMSAATMIACASNQIIMGKHSFIGPIDPQVYLQTPLGFRSIPAQAIIDQFERAKIECEDPKKLAAWMPILSQYGPDLLVESQNVLDLSRKLVSEWLEKYMFAGETDASKFAGITAEKLANHNEFKSHGHHISIEQARKLGLNVDDLEKDQTIQDLVLSAFHATTLSFDATAAVKIIENQNGKGFLKLIAPPTPPSSPTPPA